MCFIRRLFIHSMLYSFAHLSISGHGSVVSETENWRSSRADAVFFGQAELTLFLFSGTRINEQKYLA